MNIIKLIKDGQQYMRTCPKDKRLKSTFPEMKVIDLTKYAIRFMPPLVIIICVWQYYMQAEIILSIITALFALSLPIQGICWLGKRAQTTLPLNLLGWFNQLKQQLLDHNIIANAPLTPTFMALMKLLNLTKAHLGDYIDADNDDSKYGKSI